MHFREIQIYINLILCNHCIIYKSLCFTLCMGFYINNEFILEAITLISQRVLTQWHYFYHAINFNTDFWTLFAIFYYLINNILQANFIVKLVLI